MKKAIFLVGLLCLTVLLSPSLAKATCNPPNLAGPPCPIGTIPCTDSYGDSWCCTEGADECQGEPLRESGKDEGGTKPDRCYISGVGEGIMTALGCIPTEDTSQFVAWLMQRAVGIGGGIAFLLMIFAGFQIITSSGDPQKLQAGKELFTSAIVGLILIIFSVFLLELIGVRIFKIPGLGQ